MKIEDFLGLSFFEIRESFSLFYPTGSYTTRPRDRGLKEIYYLVHLMLGEGASNIFFLENVSASCFFLL